MHHAGIQRILGHAEVAIESIQGAAKPQVGVEPGLAPGPVSLDAQVGFLYVLAAKAADFHRHEAR